MRAETSNDAVRASGLDRVVYDYTVDVEEGKLKSLRGVQDSSDSQTAAFQASQRAHQPGTAAISAPTLSTQAKDAWYLEPTAPVTTPALSDQVRDTWYLDK